MQNNDKQNLSLKEEETEKNTLKGRKKKKAFTILLG